MNKLGLAWDTGDSSNPNSVSNSLPSSSQRSLLGNTPESKAKPTSDHIIPYSIKAEAATVDSRMFDCRLTGIAAMMGVVKLGMGVSVAGKVVKGDRLKVRIPVHQTMR